jgi:hypothetical protein
MKKSIVLILCLSLNILLQAQVSKIVNISAGELSSALTNEEKQTITDLTVTGTIDARDFKIMKDFMPSLDVVDMQNITVESYSGKEGPTPGLVEATYPANAVPQYAFYMSHGLKNIYLSSSIQLIEANAFFACENLKSISIPSSVNFIGKSAFRGCISLDSITIPSSITSIGEYVFASCIGLKFVNIPSSVSFIGAYAFSGCQGLDSLSLPSSIISIENNAFNYCTNLKSINLSSAVTTIGEKAFYYCYNIKAINFPQSLISIGKSAFSWCSRLTSIAIPSSVTYIDSNAFNRCHGLTSVNIPSSIKTISMGTFYECSRLLSVTIPSSVTSIEGYAFGSCPGLTSITIPSSVTSIGEYAFHTCYGLKAIYANESIPVNLSLSPDVFWGVDMTSCILFVPIGSKSLYSSANQWKYFQNIYEGDGLWVSKSDINFKKAGGVSTIKIYTDTTWTVSSDQDWLKVNSFSGKGESTITLSATRNPLEETRSAIVKVSCNEVKSKTITISQEGIFESKCIRLVIPQGTAEIDGIIEDAWDVIPEQTIDRPFKDEEPTVNSFWKAMWDEENFYVLVSVQDDNHYPGWESGDDNWKYDNVEIYWDWNDILEDGGGSGDIYSGHFSFYGKFTANNNNVVVTEDPLGDGYTEPGGKYCYSLSGENYVYEIAIPFTNFYDEVNWQLTKNIAYAKKAIGFDVTIVDQDEGITTSRQRMVWKNDGEIDENWNSMDDAGIIRLGYHYQCNDYELEVSETSKIIHSTEGSTARISVYSNNSWTAVSDQPWLTISPSSGNGYSNLTFTASKNTTNVTRTAIVTITSSGEYDFVKKITVTQEATTDVKQSVSKAFKLFPNPVTNGFRVTGLAGKATIQFTDLNGRIMQTKQISGNDYISVRSLTQGIYVVWITTDSGTIKMKLVKQ